MTTTIDNPDRRRIALTVLRARLKLTLRTGMGWRSGHPATALRKQWGFSHIKPRDYDTLFATVSDELNLPTEWRKA